MATTKKMERHFNAFLREKFHARLARDEDRVHLTSIRGNTSRAEVRNPATVLAWMKKQCKLVSETRNAATFTYQAPKKEGGLKAVVTLKHVGDHDIVTMVTKQ